MKVLNVHLMDKKDLTVDTYSVKFVLRETLIQYDKIVVKKR